MRSPSTGEGNFCSVALERLCPTLRGLGRPGLESIAVAKRRLFGEAHGRMLSCQQASAATHSAPELHAKSKP